MCVVVLKQLSKALKYHRTSKHKGGGLKQKTGIMPTDTLDYVPETRSNDDIHSKVKKISKFKHAIQSSLFINYSHILICQTEVDNHPTSIKIIKKKTSKVDIVVAVVIIVIIILKKILKHFL